MALITYSIPNLINGVSQQAPAVRRKTQAALMDNGWASVVDGLQKRPPIEHVAKILTETDYAESFVHAINRDISERYVAVFGPTEISVFGVDGSVFQVETPDGIGYLPSLPSTQMRCMTVDDYTFVVNTEKVMAMSGSTPAAINPQALVEIRAANYEMDYTVSITDADATYSVTLTTGGGVPYNRTDQAAEDLATSTTLPTISPDFEDPVRLAQVDGGVPATAAATDGLQDLLTAEATDTYVVTRSGNTLHIENTTGNSFTVEVTDGSAGSSIYASKDSVEFFTDLPTRAVHGMSIRVQSSPEANLDSYWVQFERPDAASGIGEGTWVESVDPTLDNTFNAATMPHVLVRYFDDVSGTVTGTPFAAYFSFEQWDWDDRLVGDTSSNPEPSFIGSTARDIFFFRDRLGILTPGEIVLSEAGFYSNFFRTTATTLIDSDVIDLAVSDNQVSDMYWAVPDEQDLILFSDQTQYVLESSGPLTPATASIQATTRYESTRATRPLLVGDRVLFAQQNGGFVGIREYRVDINTQKRRADEITGHVDQYIAGNVKDMTASAQQRALVTATTGNQYVYLYQWFDEGEQRLQAAWSRWDLGLGDFLLGLRFIDTTLYFVSQRGDGVYLEKIETDPGRADYDGGVVLHLDRRVNINDVNTVYDPDADTTTITLPYPCDDVPIVFTTDPACPDSCGDPDYTGVYYRIERCSDNVSPPVFVQADEFTVGDVFLRNGICYQVLVTEEVDPQLTSVLRVADVVSQVDCATCVAGPQDPDVGEPPLLANTFLRMARCEDDTMGEYSIPEQIMGFPSGDDLTKIYKLDGVCYYVTNVRESTPSDPLFPVHTAAQFDDCVICEEFCTLTNTVQTVDATVSGHVVINPDPSDPFFTITGNGTYPFNSYDDSTAGGTIKYWSWESADSRFKIRIYANCGVSDYPLYCVDDATRSFDIVPGSVGAFMKFNSYNGRTLEWVEPDLSGLSLNGAGQFQGTLVFQGPVCRRSGEYPDVPEDITVVFA